MHKFWDGYSTLKIVIVTVLLIVAQSILSPAYNIPLYICGFFIWNVSKASGVSNIFMMIKSQILSTRFTELACCISWLTLLSWI